MTPERFQAAERELDEITTLPIGVRASSAAEGALKELSARATPGHPGYHRVKSLDALIAATAWDHGFDVLHYDWHFDRLAEVLGFGSHWIAAPGEY